MRLSLHLVLALMVLSANSITASAVVPLAPVIWSFQPRIGEALEPGEFMIIDFTEAMDTPTLGVQLQPATYFWHYWSSPTQLVIQPIGSWRPSTSYRAVVSGQSAAGIPLLGQKEFFFSTAGGYGFNQSGCRSRTLTYHILGRPSPGDRPENFVEWDVFKTQITRLKERGFRFGAPDQVCWPGNESMVSIQFDDGWSSQYEAAKWLSSVGVTAFFAVTVTNLNNPAHGYMNRAQVAEISRLPGIIIGSHLQQHDCISQTAWNMEPVARAEYLRWQLQQSKLDLQAITGQPINFLVYPHGCYDGLIAREASRYYWAAWTTVGALPLPAYLTTWYGRQRLTVLNSTRF